MKKQNVLVYFPSRAFAADQISAMILFKRLNYNVHFLTLESEGALHEIAKSNGIIVNAFPIEKTNSVTYYYKHITYLIKYCKQNEIHTVLAHLQTCILIGLVASWFLKIKFIAVRHYSDNAYLSGNKKEIIIDRILAKMLNTIISPSKKVTAHLINKEKVSPLKISEIPYGYDFELYPKVNTEQVQLLKSKAQNYDLLLCTVARLVPLKRHLMSLMVLNNLIKQGYNIKLYIVGTGPLETSLKTYVEENQLTNYVFFEGFKTNVMDYYAASDAVVLLSNTEASNSSVKEAGYLKKCVIVCEDVGDFGEYIENENNGFLLPKKDPSIEFEKALIKLMENKNNFKEILGENLFDTIMSKFDINKLDKYYKNIL